MCARWVGGWRRERMVAETCSAAHLGETVECRGTTHCALARKRREPSSRSCSSWISPMPAAAQGGTAAKDVCAQQAAVPGPLPCLCANRSAGGWASSGFLAPGRPGRSCSSCRAQRRAADAGQLPALAWQEDQDSALLPLVALVDVGHQRLQQLKVQPVLVQNG